MLNLLYMCGVHVGWVLLVCNQMVKLTKRSEFCTFNSEQLFGMTRGGIDHSMMWSR